jgi:hypothetical protein
MLSLEEPLVKPTLSLAVAAALTLAPAAVLAQDAPKPSASAPPGAGPKTYDMRDDASAWINDPNVHAFYQATVDAFAQGPDHLDRAAYLQRSREIFRALALAHGMKPEALEDHLKDIPDQMVLIVSRDPKTLDSYDSFVVALFGPQPH